MDLFYCTGGKSGSAGSRRPVKTTIGVNDRVSVFLELAEAHRLLGNQVNSILFGSFVSLFSKSFNGLVQIINWKIPF